MIQQANRYLDRYLEAGRARAEEIADGHRTR
jgi:hypothetical protein